MKHFSILLSLSLLVTALLIPVSADALTVDSKIVGDEVYVSFRSVFERAGFDVNWDDYRQVAAATKTGTSVEIKGDLNYFMYNGVLLDAASTIKNIDGTLFMPIKGVSQIFTGLANKDGKVSFNNELIALKEGMRLLKNQEEIKAIKAFVKSDMLYRTDAYKDMNVPTMESSMDVVDGNETSKTDDFSGTNNQEDGVDEADFVKVDGQYIYTVRDNRLMVIIPGSDLRILHNIQLENINPTNLFVTQDKIAVIGYEQQEDNSADRIMPTGTYFNTAQTMIYIYDKSDLSTQAPKLQKKYFVDGNLRQGRNIGDNIYLVLSDYSFNIMPYTISTVDSNGSQTDHTEKTEEVYYYPGFATGGMTYTVGINLNDLSDNGLDVKSYMLDADTIYADKQSLYVTANQNYMYLNNDQATHIFKYSLNKGKIDYKVKGDVNGYLHNQFSMGTYNGNLRVAVTHYDNVSNKTMNNLYILDDSMATIGTLKNLAPDETIYSVRMMGDKVYMVTYRQVDPFYVIDASMPTQPKVLGYLKIPGYSSYLHPYDENTIIGIGMNTKVVDKNRVVNDGVKVALYDVSDVTNPVEKDAMVFNDNETYTDVGYDHKAFLFDKEKGIMSIPITVYDKNYYAKQNAHVFGFTADGKFDYRGSISHENTNVDNKNEEWNNYINRIFYIDNGLYTMSHNYLKENDITSLKDIRQLNLNDQPEIVAQKSTINIKGYITEVTPDNRVQLNNSQWLTMDDATVFQSLTNSGAKAIDRTFKLGNYIEGYTKHANHKDSVYVTAIYKNSPSNNMTTSFSGTVKEINDGTATIEPKDGEIIKSGNRVYVKYKPYFKSVKDLSVGDTVKVYYSGVVAESMPLQIKEGLVIKK